MLEVLGSGLTTGIFMFLIVTPVEGVKVSPKRRKKTRRQEADRVLRSTDRMIDHADRCFEGETPGAVQ